MAWIWGWSVEQPERRNWHSSLMRMDFPRVRIGGDEQGEQSKDYNSGDHGGKRCLPIHADFSGVRDQLSRKTFGAIGLRPIPTGAPRNRITIRSAEGELP